MAISGRCTPEGSELPPHRFATAASSGREVGAFFWPVGGRVDAVVGGRDDGGLVDGAASSAISTLPRSAESVCIRSNNASSCSSRLGPPSRRKFSSVNAISMRRLGPHSQSDGVAVWHGGRRGSWARSRSRVAVRSRRRLAAVAWAVTHSRHTRQRDTDRSRGDEHCAFGDS